MNQKTLITLGIITVVAVMAAFAIDRSRAPRSEVASASQTLVSDLRERINDVEKIELTIANNQTAVTLERSEAGWKVAQRGGYPADVGKLRDFLLTVADASLLEQKTSNRDRYADLGVEEVSVPSAKGVLVDIAGLGQPTRFIVGTVNSQGGGTFVRRSDEAQSWLAKGTLSPEKNPADWLIKDLANIPADRIASFTLTRADGQIVRAIKKAPGDARFDVIGVPKGRELSSEFVANGLGAVMSELKIEDVLPGREVTTPEQIIKARYVAFDGLVIEVGAWKVGEQGHARFVASLDAAIADKHITEQQQEDAVATTPADAASASSASPSSSVATSDAPATPPSAAPADPAKDRESRMTALNAEVAALNRDFADWVFVLPAYKFTNIDKSMDDLLTPVETK
ncbi:MAG: DUF4340 domain-containing protein [Dokdonella sp.]